MKSRETREQSIVAAVERERERFAGDLHDSVCQELVGIAMMLDALSPRVASDVATETGAIAERIRRVTFDARRMALGLGSIVVERAGLVGALALLKLDVEALSGPAVSVSVDEPFARVPLNMAINLYRIAQEATANALRHSGATHIYISAEVCAQGLLLAIQDDGCGIRDADRKICGLGIRSMVSRAESLGGELRLLPGVPQGTRVQAIVPTDLRKA